MNLVREKKKSLKLRFRLEEMHKYLRLNDVLMLLIVVWKSGGDAREKMNN